MISLSGTTLKVKENFVHPTCEHKVVLFTFKTFWLQKLKVLCVGEIFNH